MRDRNERDTEREGRAGAYSALAAAFVALGVWFGGVITATAAIEPTRDVFVLAAPAVLDRLHGIDASIVDASGSFVRLRGDGPGFVARLYGAGAWLVLPAGAGGCLGIVAVRGSPDAPLREATRR
jgi:hypothetical protein